MNTAVASSQAGMQQAVIHTLDLLAKFRQSMVWFEIE